MCPPFGNEQCKRNDSEHKLQPLRALFLRSQRLYPPLRSGTSPQAPLPPQHIKVNESPGEGQAHHRDTNGILMESSGGSIYSCSGRQRSQANRNANSAHGQHCSACALQKGKDEAGPSEPSGRPAGRTRGGCRSFRYRRRLRGICHRPMLPAFPAAHAECPFIRAINRSAGVR